LLADLNSLTSAPSYSKANSGSESESYCDIRTGVLAGSVGWETDLTLFCHPISYFVQY